MKPISFHKQQTTYTGDEDRNIGNMHVLRIQYNTSPALVSCWKPSLLERMKILLGGRVYLAILGTSQPPVLLTGNAKEVLGDGAADPDIELATW
jgi:hypothetical protein